MRYFLHQRRSDGDIRDLEGSEHPDLGSAEAEAFDSAVELMADAVRRGRGVGGNAFEIADEHGTVLATVPFSSVFTRSG